MFTRNILNRKFAQRAVKKATKNAKGQNANTISVDVLRKSKYLDFNITSDLYRIDLGLLIQRPAIYLPLQNIEVDKLNLDAHFYFKNGLRYQFNPILMNFPDQGPNDESDKKDFNNIKTHSRKNEDGTTTTYAMNSKLYEEVDPSITDNKSIQYSPFTSVYLLIKHVDGKWCLPYRMIGDRKPIEINLNRFKNQTLGGKLIIKERETYPVASMIHPIEKGELAKNKLLSKLKGRKVMVFTAYHTTGTISIDDEPYYEDWAWVPKAKLNEYLDEESYKEIIGVCDRY